MSGVRVDATADIVVVGGGVAGLSAVLSADGAEILVVHPPADRGSSVCALGGIAAALHDDADEHARDTRVAGANHCDVHRVDVLVREGRERVCELLDAGMPFDRDRAGHLSLGLEAGHSRPRILHAGGDATGRALVEFLAGRARAQRRVRRMWGTVVEVVLDEHGRTAGVVVVQSDGESRFVRTPNVVLATGGIGSLFDQTSNPGSALGAGIALAVEAGAAVVDMEFVQFHPTALAVDARPMPLVTEALRGAGALLVDGSGARMMEGVHPDLELAPRDVVARAIWERRRRGEGVYLDTRHVDRLPQRFPSLLQACTDMGVDARRIPVTPAAHFHMGGVEVDDWGATGVEGLWACGEVACTGVHGANRLASNSLLEGLVFGHRVGQAIAARGAREPGPAWPRTELEPPLVHLPTPLDGSRTLAQVFSTAFGLERSRATLRTVVEWIELIMTVVDPRSPCGRRLRVAQLLGYAALHRSESRGAHFRLDHPTPDPRSRFRLRQRLRDGELVMQEVATSPC